MSTVERHDSWFRTIVREHWLPLLILIVPINIAVWVSEYDFPRFAPALSVPIAAIILGWVLKPRHVWVVWIGAILILWASIGIWGGFTNPGPDETVMSLLFESIVWMAIGVAIPLWLGRTARIRKI
jgi:hypothetical protein